MRDRKANVLRITKDIIMSKNNIRYPRIQEKQSKKKQPKQKIHSHSVNVCEGVMFSVSP